MFQKFFWTLREKGIHVTLGEWLDLQAALDKGLCGSSLTQFYYVARMILVKSETDFDKYDTAFEECFKAVQKETEVGSQMLRWLDKSDLLELAHEEARAHLNQMEDLQIDKEDVEEKFKQRLKDQNEEHNGGSFWIGTMGKTLRQRRRDRQSWRRPRRRPDRLSVRLLRGGSKEIPGFPRRQSYREQTVSAGLPEAQTVLHQAGYPRDGAGHRRHGG